MGARVTCAWEFGVGALEVEVRHTPGSLPAIYTSELAAVPCALWQAAVAVGCLEIRWGWLLLTGVGEGRLQGPAGSGARAGEGRERSAQCPAGCV